MVVAARPPGTNKNVLKEGPGGKQIDGEALQDTAQEYVQKVQVGTRYHYTFTVAPFDTLVARRQACH